MKQVLIQPLTTESFARYGTFQNLLDISDLEQKSVTSGGFFADVLSLDFGKRTLPTVSVCYVTKQPRNIVSFVEAHQETCEGLLPLDADIVIFVGAMGWGECSSDSLEAFLVPKGTFVKLNPLILHGKQYLLDAEQAHIACFLPMRTFRNDTLYKDLSESEQVELVTQQPAAYT